MLSVHNFVLLSEILTNPHVGYCTFCNRRLMVNNRSCAYCNAEWSGSHVGAPFRRRRVPSVAPAGIIGVAPTPVTSGVDMSNSDFLRLVLHTIPFRFSPTSPVARSGLTQAAREHFLTPLEQVPEDSQCSVCLETLEVQPSHPIVALPCCRNKFHISCIDPWFQSHSTCPVCRHDMNDRYLQQDDQSVQ